MQQSKTGISGIGDFLDRSQKSHQIRIPKFEILEISIRKKPPFSFQIDQEIIC